MPNQYARLLPNRDTAQSSWSIVGGQPTRYQAVTFPATFTNGVSTFNSRTYTSATANFTTADIDRPIRGTNIPVGTYIKSINSATSVELSRPAQGTGSGLTFLLYRTNDSHYIENTGSLTTLGFGFEDWSPGMFTQVRMIYFYGRGRFPDWVYGNPEDRIHFVEAYDPGSGFLQDDRDYPSQLTPWGSGLGGPFFQPVVFGIETVPDEAWWDEDANGNLVPITYAALSPPMIHNRGIQLRRSTGTQKFQFTRLELVVVYNDPPTVDTIVATGTSTSRPTLSWNYTDPEGDAQERVTIKLFTAATSDVENTTANLVYSGEFFQTTTTRTIPVDLQNGQQYWAYVKAADADSNGRYGAYSATTTFTIALDPPATPTLAVEPFPSLARYNLTAWAEDNMLSLNASSLETDASGWTINSNLTEISRQTTVGGFHGTAALRMTANVAGTDASVRSVASTLLAGLQAEAFPVIPGRLYTSHFRARSATNSRSWTNQINFYDAAGVAVGSAVTGPRASTSGTTWAQVWVSAVAPATAAWAVIFPTVRAPSAGDVHYIDAAYFGSVPLRNLLTPNQSSLETDVSAYEPTLNATVGESAVALDGTRSLRLVSTTASGEVAAVQRTGQTTGATAGYASSLTPVLPNISYTASASFRAETTARATRLDLRWFTSAGAFISTTSGTSTPSDSTTDWVRNTVTGTAPATAAYVAVTPRVLAVTAIGEAHLVDRIHLIASSSSLLSANSSSFETDTTGVATGTSSPSIARAGTQNRLSLNAASAETDTSAWGSTNGTLSLTQAQAAHGRSSVALTNTVAGSMFAELVAAQRPSAVAGTTYSARMSVRAATVARSCFLTLRFFDAGGLPIAGDIAGSAATNSTSAWTQYTVSGVAPANTASVAVFLTVSAAALSEVHYFGMALIATGATPSVWTLPGPALEGSWSIAMTQVVAGPASMNILTNPPTPVTAGVSYTATIHSRAATTARAAGAQINWYGASGYISTTSGPTTTNSANLWTQHQATGIAPAGATTAQVTLYVPSTPVGGETHFFDSVAFGPTSDLDFTVGSLAATTAGQAVTIERSLDAGLTWTPIRSATNAALGAGQELTVYDYEVPRDVTPQYRALISATPPGGRVVSPYSAIVTPAPLSLTGWWLKAPLRPALNTQVTVNPPFSFRIKEPQSTYEPLGARSSVVVSDGARGIEGTLELWAKSQSDYAAIEALVRAGQTLWLEDVLGRSWYIRLGRATEWEMIRAAPDPVLDPPGRPVRHFHRVVLPFTEVGVPLGLPAAA